MDGSNKSGPERRSDTTNTSSIPESGQSESNVESNDSPDVEEGNTQSASSREDDAVSPTEGGAATGQYDTPTEEEQGGGDDPPAVAEGMLLAPWPPA